ncbi:MAG: tetratricopeptide repeat protein [Bdellovibrionales bacterium]|nr:tetratricopeptide repeat protein [Bdellovibrionales bacterium]
MAAEDFEVFTPYVEGCLSEGRIVVRENMDSLPRMKSVGNASSSWSKLRPELVKTPRSLPLLKRAMILSIQDQDFPYAQAIAQRMIEIDPQSSEALSDLGVCQLFLGEWEASQVSLTEALKKNPKNSSALWALAGLYKKYSFNKKYALFLSRAKAAGRPSPPVHSLMKIGS